MRNFLYFLMLVWGFHPLFSQQITEDMVIPVCDNQSITTGAPSNTGVYNLNITCGDQPLSPYMDFYYVKILSGTTFAFKVSPVGQDDYDFGAYKNPVWNNIQATPAVNKRGSQNDPFQSGIFSLGLSLTATDTCEPGGSVGAPEPGMVRYFDVTAGDEILIAIDRWSQTTLGYTLEFGGDAILDCTVLGNSYGKCDVDENDTEQFTSADFLPDLNQDFPGNTFKFYYTQSDAEANNTNYVNFPLTVNYNNGTATEIFVRVETGVGGFVKVLKIFLYVNKIPELLTDLVEIPLVCDDDDDAQSVFDLTQTQSQFVNDPADFSFKYYTSEAAALAGGNDNIPNPAAYQTATATIYVRIQSGSLNGNEEGCFVIARIKTEVSDFYVEEKTIETDGVCDNDGDGFSTVDLTESITEIVDSPTAYQISYHESLADAQNGTNPITNPENYSIQVPGTTTVFVRIKSLNDICYSVSKLVYNTIERPSLYPLEAVLLCSEQQDGTVAYDLTQFASEIIDNPTAYTIGYYESAADAQNGSNAIENPSNYQLSLNMLTTIHIRVENNGCFNVGSVQITISSVPFLNENLEIGPLCDEDGDGTITVDLTENESYFAGNPNDFQISYHHSQQDAESGDNPITDPENFEITAGNTVVVYIRVESENGLCYSVRTISYSTSKKPVLNEIEPVILCVEEQGTSYSVDLTQLDIIANPENYTINYYQNFNDAELGQNPIQPADDYEVPMNQSAMSSVFIRVEKDACFSIGEVKFWINSNPVISELDEQAFCTDLESGEIAYDLTLHQTEWVANPTDFDFQYYSNQTDLENGTNQIPNPAAWLIPVGTNSQIYVKIINADTQCFSTTVLNLFPGSKVNLTEGLEIEFCDDDFDGIYHYDLTTINDLLIENTTGLEFHYYLNQADAQNNQNELTQNQAFNFQFNSIPYSIWITATTTDGCPSEPVKIQFIKGQEIELITAVIGPVKYCQDEVIDLTAYETDISTEDVTFEYYQNLSNAQQELNPIAGLTAFHPQGNNSVFVRIEMVDYCAVIAEIKFQKLPTPDIMLNSEYVELCPGDSFMAVAESSDPNPGFEWFYNNQLVGSGASFEITQNGSYTVIVTGAENCENEKTLSVVSPPTPVITGIEMGQDFIIVSANAGGGASSSLEYSLDQILWQSSPRFDNLIPGETYTVYVRQAACMTDSYRFTLLLISNFISPNGDGKNDTWAIRGIEVSQGATLKIFDRYGKIFIDTSFGGNYVWDGKYMGRPVASDDYWYIIEIPGDGIIKSKRFSGHISVRNQ